MGFISPKTSAKTLTFNNGIIVFDDSASTGVKVDISDSQVSNVASVDVVVSNLGTKLPPATGAVQVDGIGFYDVKVISTSQLGQNAVATIYLTNTAFTNGNVISYWDGNNWTQSSTIFSAPNTISASIPVSALTGTLIAVNSNNSSTDLQFVSNYIIIALAVVVILLVAVVFVFLRRKKTKKIVV